jgi:CxxC-x17-CxxC domain-containing protein
MGFEDDDRGGYGGRGGRGGGRGGHGGRGGYGGGGGYDRGPREMHQAVCSECGQACEVPFKPTEGRPVYCRDCFQKHKKF